jgi:hypothetical protein
MGQYWLAVSLDRHEFIDPRGLGAGLKLCEQAGSWPGTGAALVVLCAAMPVSRGGGDLKPHPAVARWAGCRVALVGDYAEDSDLPAEFEASSIYRKCRSGEWADVTAMVVEVLEREFGERLLGEGLPEAARTFAPDVVIVGPDGAGKPS